MFVMKHSSENVFLLHHKINLFRKNYIFSSDEHFRSGYNTALMAAVIRVYPVFWNKCGKAVVRFCIQLHTFTSERIYVSNFL